MTSSLGNKVEACAREISTFFRWNNRRYQTISRRLEVGWNSPAPLHQVVCEGEVVWKVAEERAHFRQLLALPVDLECRLVWVPLGTEKAPYLVIFGGDLPRSLYFARPLSELQRIETEGSVLRLIAAMYGRSLVELPSVPAKMEAPTVQLAA